MLLALDGMAHYVTADINKKWSTLFNDAGGQSVITIAAEGRFGNCLKKTFAGTSNVSSQSYVEMAPRVTRTGIWVPQASGVVGCALKIENLNNLRGREHAGDANVSSMISVREGSRTHFGITIEPNGCISLIVEGPGSDAEYKATSAEIFQNAVWLYLEMKWTLHASTGTVIVMADGMEMINYTGRTISTESGIQTLGVWNSVRMLNETGLANESQSYRMCDFYLADQDAQDAQDVADFLGDGIIDKIRPDGVGNSTQWTPSAGNNWDNVNDDTQHDGESTYNATETPGNSDLYTYEDIPAGAEVLAAQWVGLFRKEEEGFSSITPQCRIGATTYDYVEQGVPDVTYSRYLLQPMDISPATGTDWTDTEINGAQWGVEKTG